MKARGQVERQGLGWLLVLPAVAILALLVFGLSGRTGKATLYFADKDFRGLVAETRNTPLLGNMEERASELLSELVLGPMDPDKQPLFQGDVRLGTVMQRGSNLVVDLEISDLGLQKLSFDLVRKAMEQSLADTVPGAGRLLLFVNGRQVRG